jgi:hypothetical protein
MILVNIMEETPMPIKKRNFILILYNFDRPLITTEMLTCLSLCLWLCLSVSLSLCLSVSLNFCTGISVYLYNLFPCLFVFFLHYERDRFIILFVCPFVSFLLPVCISLFT